MNRLFYLSLMAAVVTFCLFDGLAFAQEDFYYSRGEKIPLTISTEKISIKFKGGVTQPQIQSLLSIEPILGEPKPLRPSAVAKDFITVSLKNRTDVLQLVQRLRKRPEVDIVNPVYMVEGLEAIPFDHFIVQFKPSVTGTEIEALNKQHHVEIVEVSTASPNLYTFRITSASDLSVVEMAKLYYESLPCEWSLPDFIVPIELFSIPNDTYFQYQYYLHNTGQTGGVPDADIDAPEAWDISRGSSSIIVAVIDEGGTSHEDLPSSRIVAGYDFVYLDTDPSPGGNEAHGMACIGIIGASHNNNLGVSGLAPNCKIMPIRIFDEWGDGTSINNVANSVDYAWQNGAHVISGSWGYGTSNPNHPYLIPIRDAINRALTQGRGGKGTVVVFAAGNTANRSGGYYGYVAFPACISGVIAVGATDKSNNIQYYSPRGTDTQLSVVAPSGDLGFFQPDNSIKLKGDVWSMDMSGHQGWNKGDYGIGSPTYYVYFTWDSPGGDSYPPGNYSAHFGGTSAACPQVSGVSALLLTINSNLTASQVKSIIQNSATDMGAQGYDTDFGYGRVNAYKALKYTLEHYGGTLTSSFTIPSGETWTFLSGASVNLNGFNITTSGGTITVESGATINPDIRLQTGSTINGLYPTINAAFSAASGGQSVHLRGTHNFADHFTVPSGKTLKTESNSQMNFAPGKYLYVYGTLNAYNTTYTTSSGTWNGIRYYSGSSGSIQYANISNASVGVYAGYSNPVVSYTNISDCDTGVRPFHSNMTINNSTIDNCNYGVYAQSGSPDINNSSISNCTYGIRLSESNAQITSNEITGCTRGIYGYYADMTKIVNNLITSGPTSRVAGVQFYNSNEPNMYNNTISGYFTYLLDADHYSRPLAIGPGSQNYQGYNRMMGGSTATLYAHDHSEVVFGTGFTQSTDGYAGYNTIYLDIGTDRFAHVRAYSYSNVIAQKNYWGDYPPVDFVADGSSDIDYSYALSTDPGGGSTLGKMSGTYTGDAITENVNTHDMEPDEKLWMEAGEYWQNLNYRKALETYNILLNNYSDSPYASRAFLRSVYAKRARKSTDIEEYLQKYVNTPNLRTMTLEMLIGEDIRRNRYEEAIDKIKTVISENPDSEAEYKALFTLFNVYHMNMDDQNKAATVLEQMKTRYGDHGLTQIAQYDMGEPVEWKVDEPIEFGEEKPEPDLASTSHYRLDKNSPNPFNPVTRIDFELPEAAFTKLTVYDLLGREVRKLVNGHMEPGSHHVTWDGRNDTGKILPNGVYICVLKANDFKATRKMILLK